MIKEGQNSTFIHRGYKVVTTMKKVFVYADKKLIGVAGVTKAKDFNFLNLFKWAMHESGSNLKLA